MARNTFRGLLGDAVKLNVQYYSTLFDATSDYLKALKDLVETPRGGDDVVARSAAPAPSEAPPAATAPPVPPLVLAAAAGEVAETRFAVTNSTTEEVAADIGISPELREAGVTAEPSGMMMAPGQQVVFRLFGRPAASVPEGTDVNGTVAVPRLGDKAIPVVLRRLPDPAPAPAAKAAKPARAAAKKPAAAGSRKTAAAKTTRKPAAAKGRTRKSDP